MEAWGRSGISPVPTTMESSQGSLTFKFLFERFTKNFSLFFFSFLIMLFCRFSLFNCHFYQEKSFFLQMQSFVEETVCHFRRNAGY